jgi:HEAT repeat protein
MNRLERTLLVATGALLVVGTGVFAVVARRDRGGPRPGEVVVPSLPETGDPAARASAGGRTPDGTAEEGTGTLTAPRAGGGIPPALRTPEGIDLSDPAVVKARLREYLAVEDPRWDWVAQLLGVLAGPLDEDIRWKLETELVRGNAAGAIQAYAHVRDGTVVPSLLRLLDDPETDAHDRANVLHALGQIPAGDEAVLVTGIESRLDGDPAHDLPYLQAIARRGGPEGARALVDALSKAPDPARYPPETWHDLDLRKSPEASEVLATALADRTRSPGALRAIADLAGRPGASRAVVDALAALDADGQDRLVRTQALLSLGATGDDRAIERLLAQAGPSGDYGSVATRAIAEIDAATPAARARLLETAQATQDENLRTHLATAFGNLKEKRAVPMLVEGLEKGSQPRRHESLVALGRIGADANPSIEAIGRAFTTGNEGFRSQVAITLANVGTPEAKRLLDQLAVAEKDPRVLKAIQVSQRRFESLARQ